MVVANKFELTRNGKETILSGGYIYTKIKTFFDNPFVLEYYGQYQWAEARGLEKKYALGANVRYKLYKNTSGGAFIGLGPFYEFEQWGYEGVPDERLPAVQESITNRLWKLNFYLSSQRNLADRVTLEAAFYLQDRFDNFLAYPRLGTSGGVSFKITEYIAFGVQFRAIYDYKPVVPVDPWWFSTFTELQVTF